VRDVLVPARDRTVAVTKRGARRLTRTRAGRAATGRLKRLADRLHPADPQARSARPAEIGPVADGTLTIEDAVDLGHRLILARPPDPQFRNSLLRQIRDGRLTVGQAFAVIASSDEFAGRVAHQRAIIRAAEPALDAGLIDVRELAGAKSIEEHNAAAEDYFAGRDEAFVESMLAKPFAQSVESTELLTCFAHMVDGLRLLPGDRLLDFAAGTGWTSWMFSQLNVEVICSDVSPSALAMARRRYRRWPSIPGRPDPSFLVFDGHRLDLPDSSVDKICCFDAFHHLINQAEVMVEFARVLRPGGLIGFDEPGHHHSKAAQSQYEMRTFGVVEGDIDLRDMAAMAAAAGLEFVAADMLTVRPIWSDLASFTDLVATRVPSAAMIQQFAHQIHNKQQFILRKPGGPGPDSRDLTVLRGELQLVSSEVRRDGEDYRTRLEVVVRNTGAARWLGPDAPVGAVVLAARASGTPGWNLVLEVDPGVDLDPAEQRAVTAVATVPGSLRGQELVINLLAAGVTWFDICGTEPIVVALPE
jgi:SAM-dependent methyltransferase